MTKERLRQYRKMLKDKKQMEQHLETIEAALYNPKIQQVNDMPRAQSHGNAMEDLANKHLELRDRYRDKLAELTLEGIAIAEAIENLPVREQNVLSQYYINGLKWEEVCVKVGYSWTQVHRIHSSALQHLAGKAEEPKKPKREVWEMHVYGDDCTVTIGGWFCSACGYYVKKQADTCPGCHAEMEMVE